MADKVSIMTEIKPDLFAGQTVGIIIPFHGQQHRVNTLVSSLVANTMKNPYRVQLVDDCSPNSDQQDYSVYTDLSRLGFVGYTRLEKQSGFGAAVNAGLALLPEAIKWIVVLHSDVQITHTRWLQYMGETMQTHKHLGVKMVGSRSDNPGPDAHPSLTAPGLEPVGEDVILEDDPLPLYCVLFHRELFRHIGGGLKEYPYVGYEDEELGYRMRHYGFRQAVCGKSWVGHAGGATIDPLCQRNPKLRRQVTANRDLCVKDIRTLLGKVQKKDRVITEKAKPKAFKPKGQTFEDPFAVFANAPLPNLDQMEIERDLRSAR